MRAKGCPPGVTGRRCTKRGRDPDQRSAEALGGRTSTCRSSTWSAASLVLQCLVRFRSTSDGQGCGAAPVHPVTAPCRRNARAVPSGPPRFPPPLPLYPAPPPGPLQVWLPPSSLPGPPARRLLPALPPPLATGTSRERKAAQRAGVSHASLGAGGRLGAARAPAGQKSRLARLLWWLAASPQPSLWIERWGWTPSPAVFSVGCWSRSRRAVWSTWGRGAHGWSAAARSPRLGRRPWSEPPVRPRPSRVDMRPEGDARHSQRHAAKSRSFAGRHGLSPPPLSGLSSLSSDET